jgi:FKBP-type peptidyl-prolyl cis-trans isomerase FklB
MDNPFRAAHSYITSKIFMKKVSLLLGVFLLAAGLYAQKAPAKSQAKKPAKPATAKQNVVLGTPVATPAASATPKTAEDSAAYAYGVLIATNLQRQFPDMNPDQVASGLNAVLKTKNAIMTPEAANQCLTEFSGKAAVKAAEKGKKEGEAFLAQNKTRPGVVTTASGLQYEIMKKGTGTVSPVATDQVQVHYHGTTIDGGVFDSSVERGEPITFGLNQVIAGWTEGVQLMKEGDKFKFFIPANLAYGDRSPSPKIKAGSTLIFEVELFKVNPN